MVCTIRPINTVDFFRNSLNTIFNSSADQTVRYDYPLLNAYESGDVVTVVAEIPGVAKEDLNISFENGVLTLSGKRAERKIPENSTTLYHERSSVEFEKSIKIPVKINDSSIAASLKDGILTITLPKSDDVKPKTITIN